VSLAPKAARHAHRRGAGLLTGRGPNR